MRTHIWLGAALFTVCAIPAIAATMNLGSGEAFIFRADGTMGKLSQASAATAAGMTSTATPVSGCLLVIKGTDGRLYMAEGTSTGAGSSSAGNSGTNAGSESSGFPSAGGPTGATPDGTAGDNTNAGVGNKTAGGTGMGDSAGSTGTDTGAAGSSSSGTSMAGSFDCNSMTTASVDN